MCEIIESNDFVNKKVKKKEENPKDEKHHK
jgi:hypothetical protein